MSAPTRDPTGLEPPRPHGVVRLSRRGLWALGIVLVAVAVSGIVALQAQDRRRRERQSTTLPAPPADARWYQKQSDALFTPVELSPAPTPLATPALRLAPREPEKDPLEARREQAYLRALDSKALLSGIDRGTGRGLGRAASSSETSYPAGIPASPAALERLEGALGGSASPEDQNLQGRKEDFIALAGRGETLKARVRPSVSPYEVKAGSVLPAVLLGGLNSDLPGQAVAQVRENVFDTASGAHLLLPQGTRIVGLYDSHVAFGQQRVLVNWKRIIFPDGRSLSLQDGMPGADAAGFAGFSDQIDNHLFDLFGRAILLSAITTGVSISQRGLGGDDRGLGASAADVASASLGQNLGQVATELVRRGLNRQPTLIIRPGYRFNVMVTQDLVLPGPYVSDTPEKE